MTKIELLEMILKNAREYRKGGMLESIKRNGHMNDWYGEDKDFDIMREVRKIVEEKTGAK